MIAKFDPRNRKHPTIIRYEKYLDILNRLNRRHSRVWQTDRRTDKLYDRKGRAFHCVVWPNIGKKIKSCWAEWNFKWWESLWNRYGRWGKGYGAKDLSYSQVLSLGYKSKEAKEDEIGDNEHNHDQLQSVIKDKLKEWKRVYIFVLNRKKDASV